PRCKVEVKGQTEDQILDDVLSMSTGLRFHVVAPVARQKKGEFAQEIASWLSRGYTKAKIDGELVDLSTIQKLKKTKPHNIDLVVDRIILKSELTHRLRESIQNALRLANGIFNIETPDGKLIKSYSLKASCPKCGFSFPEIEPRI